MSMVYLSKLICNEYLCQWFIFQKLTVMNIDVNGLSFKTYL